MITYFSIASASKPWFSRRGTERGYKRYDFGGSGIQDEGEELSRFKSRFGSEAIPYGRHTYMHIPFALQLSEWGYGVYRQVRDLTTRLRYKEAA